MRTAFLSIAVVLVAAMAEVEAREGLRIVGSSTVYPFAVTTGDTLAREGVSAPKIVSTTSGAGMKRFCAGVGIEFPDIAMTSRPATEKEATQCTQNDVGYTEIKVGNDANVLAHRSNLGNLDLTSDHLWRAIAAQVPVDGRLVPNPYRKWSDIDPSLPAQPIQVYGPPPGAGVRDGFIDQFIRPACAANATIAALTAEQIEEHCAAFRTDGGFVEFEKAAAVILALLENEMAVGMTSYSLVARTAEQDHLATAPIDGITPTRESISTGLYKGSQALFLYLKNDHLTTVPEIKGFAAEFVSDAASGDSGYLVAQGLVPLARDQRQEMQARVDGLAGSD